MADGNTPDYTSFGSDKIRHDPTSNKCVDAHAIDLTSSLQPEVTKGNSATTGARCGAKQNTVAKQGSAAKPALIDTTAWKPGLETTGGIGRKDPFRWTVTPRSPTREFPEFVTCSNDRVPEDAPPYTQYYDTEPEPVENCDPREDESALDDLFASVTEGPV